jgi:hypothetical protein
MNEIFESLENKHKKFENFNDSKCLSLQSGPNVLKLFMLKIYECL